MEFSSIYSLIYPKLKTLSSTSPPGTFYNILANALNEWFDRRLIIQYGSVAGVVTYPQLLGVSTPFYYNGLKPIAESLNINPTDLKAFSTFQEKIFPMIFNYIGIKITQATINWSTTSALWPKFLGISAGAYVNPIMITGTIPSGVPTPHFYVFGEKFINRIKTEPPESPDTFKAFWTEFENFLKKAITTSPPMTGVAVGTTPGGGIFNGTATVKLLADPGDNNDENNK